MHQTNEAMYIYRDHLKSEISCKLCVHSGYESSEKVQTAAQCNRLLSSSRVLLEVLQQETAASRTARRRTRARHVGSREERVSAAA